MTLTSSSDAVSSSFSPSSSMPARRSFASLFASKRVESDWSVPAYSQSAEVVAEENERDLKLDLLIRQLERHLSDASCYSTDNESNEAAEDSRASSVHSGEFEEEEECKTPADDHLEEFAEVQADDRSASYWSLEYEDQSDCDSCCSEDDAAADLFDSCLGDLYCVSGRYSRKALRASSASSSAAASSSSSAAPTRLCTSSLRYLSSHRKALSAACVKTAPTRPSRRDQDSSSDLKPSRRVEIESIPVVHTAVGPYHGESSEHRASRCILLHKARKEIAEREAAEKKQQMKELAASLLSASSVTAAAPTHKAATTPLAAAPSMPKSLARACASAARKLPQALQECSNPRWQAVLQQRAASKAAINAAKASRPQRAAQGSRVKVAPTPSSAPDGVTKTEAHQTNKERKAAAVALRNEQARVASELKALKQTTKSKAAPKVAPLAASTLIRSTTAARWTASHPALAAASRSAPSSPASAADASSSDAPSTVSKPHARLPSKSKVFFLSKAAERAAAATKAAATPLRLKDLEPLAPVDEAARARKRNEKLKQLVQQQQQQATATATLSREFDRFRRDWYYTHRSVLESPFHSQMAALRIRLSQVSPHVQEGFLARLAEAGGKDKAKIIPTFHGTAEANIPSILTHGFIKPGKPICSAAGVDAQGRSVGVAHGSSYGVGVYSSTTADFSLGYCQGASSMFICAVILSGQHTRSHNNIIVAFSEANIVPLFHLEFASPHAAGVASNKHPVNSPAAVAARNRAKRAGEQQARADEKRIRDRMTAAPSKNMLREMLREMHSRMIRSARV